MTYERNILRSKEMSRPPVKRYTTEKGALRSLSRLVGVCSSYYFALEMQHYRSTPTFAGDATSCYTAVINSANLSVKSKTTKTFGRRHTSLPSSVHYACEHEMVHRFYFEAFLLLRCLIGTLEFVTHVARTPHYRFPSWCCV